MERDGGFHGYRKLPNSSSGLKLSAEMTSRLPSDQQVNSSVNANNSSAADDNECTVREQDRFMPIANVIRIMRKILPPHAKISDDAKETIQECVSEYISFITGEANERCQREQRKTITAEDVLWAMSKLGFDDYIEPLTMYLHRYREMEGDRGGSLRGEPLGKRTLDYGATLGVGVGVAPPGAAFAQTVSVPFHIGHHHHHHHHHPNGFYGSHAGSTVPMGASAYTREPANNNNAGGSSQGPMSSVEPKGQFK